MKRKILGLLIAVTVALVFMGCPNPTTPKTPDLIASTIIFQDGNSVTKMIGSGPYKNTLGGRGVGTVSYTSGTPATATVNASTGEVTLIAPGTTVITASKAATAEYTAVSASYTLTVIAAPSTISFADGTTVTKMLGIGTYTNTVSGEGSASLTYTSGTPATATVNASTGEVTLRALGTTVITASKDATATHTAVSASYTLTVTPSIVFADGATVTKMLGTGTYTNTVSGEGSDSLTYTSGTPATATVNASTGVVSLVASGTTVITASKAAAEGHPAESASYTLKVISGPSMVSVPAGTFQRDVSPTNISEVSAFGMSSTEITRSQFVVMLNTDPSNTNKSTGLTDPVQCTSWYHAIAFCNKLSLAEGLSPVYTVPGVDFTTLTYADIPGSNNTNWNAVTATWTNTGYRLPTEMEWMWAAMGAPADGQTGTNTTGYRKLYAGGGITDVSPIVGFVWFSNNSLSTTHPTGSKTANEQGLFDMSGNVREWCWDWSFSYPSGNLTNYKGASSGEYRIYRGGSWEDNSPKCAVAYREGEEPNYMLDTVGFRVVRRP